MSGGGITFSGMLNFAYHGTALACEPEYEYSLKVRMPMSVFAMKFFQFFIMCTRANETLDKRRHNFSVRCMGTGAENHFHEG